MSWSSLPDDVAGLILASLSLVELARVSTTCGAFQALYRRQLTREHEARCGLAVNYFGRERITGITAAIIQLMKGEPLERVFEKCRIRGVFVWGDLTHNSGARTVSIYPEGCQNGDAVCVYECHPLSRAVLFFVPRDRKGVEISTGCSDDEDVGMVALVQAILSGGLAQFLYDSGKRAQIHISRVWRVSPSLDMARRAGLKAQLAPLMRFASRCICTESICMGPLIPRSVILKYRLQIGQVEPAAEEETA